MSLCGGVFINTSKTSLTQSNAVLSRHNRKLDLVAHDSDKPVVVTKTQILNHCDDPSLEVIILLKKLLVTVYYESNCPDSKTFILEQLQPAFQLLHKHITIKFVPFGKSKSINYGDGGFECQHGSAECLGNIVQDCTLYLMKKQSDRNKLMYVACEMKTLAASQGKFDCVEKANLHTNLVEECVLLGKGTILQLESEYYTNLVNHKFIPTITINDVYIQDIQDYAQVDLIGTLCSLITEAPPCSRYYNLMALYKLMRTNFKLHGK